MSVNAFYRVEISGQRADQWVLKVDAADPGMFNRGGYVKPPEEVVDLGLLQSGRPLAFNLAHPFTPVVTPEIGAMIESLAPGDIQRLPARVNGFDDRYEILNILTVENDGCIDSSRTPRSLTGSWEGSLLRLNLDRVHHRVFRVVSMVIVSGDIMEALEAKGVENIEFILVS